MVTDPGCFWHGPEPVKSEHTTICVECGHAFTTDELIAEDLRVRRELADDYFTLDMILPQPPEKIFACPLCSHDF